MSGQSGMSAQQPPFVTDSFKKHFARSIETYTDRRCRIIDEIWDKYATPHAEILINAAEEDAQNRMDQKKQQNDQNGQRKQSVAKWRARSRARPASERWPIRKAPIIQMMHLPPRGRLPLARRIIRAVSRAANNLVKQAKKAQIKDSGRERRAIS